MGELTTEEMKYAQQAGRTVAALEAAQRASIQTAAANERLIQAQSNTATVAARTATAEEKLAQEREKSLQAVSKTEKAELDTAKAREQLRVATIRAEQAEKKALETKKSYGLATDIVHKQIKAFVSGAALMQAGRMMMQFGKDAISAASDVEEGAAKFEQVFQDMSSSVEDDLEKMAGANRRSIYDLKDWASELQNTFVPLGFAREEAAEFSKTITQLGIDIAAFSNKDDADVIHNLTSAIVGNHEAVRSYGIVLTQTVINQELARNGWNSLTGAALETAKAQARLNIIMNASKDAQGAAVREADSYANVLKAWDAAVLDLKASVGEGLLPAMVQLTETAIALVTIMKAGDTFRIPHEEALQSAQTVEEIVRVVREAEAELNELDLWQWMKVNSTDWVGLESAEDQLIRLAEVAKDATEFQRIANEEFSKLQRDTAVLNFFDLDKWTNRGGFYDVDADLEGIYKVVQARKEAARMTNAETGELVEMAAAYERLKEKQDAMTADPTANLMPKDSAAARREYLQYLEFLTDRAGQAADAQKALDIAFGQSWQAAPVDDLVQARASMAALTADQDMARLFGADVKAAEEAQQAVVAANQAIAESHYQRAFDSLAAGLIEAGQFEHLADLAVSLGLMTREEANLRQAYAETSAVLDDLLKRTSDYTLTGERQGEVIKGLVSGYWDTAEAALAAAENADKALKATQAFYDTTPDSTQIGDYYRQLASGGGAGTTTGITTDVGIEIDPASRAEFIGFRSDLEAYDKAVYQTTIQSDAKDSIDDFEKMRDKLTDLTRSPWIIQLKYETQGAQPGSPIPPGANPDRSAGDKGGGPAVDITVNNYAGVGVENAVRTGVMSALRSLG